MATERLRGLGWSAGCALWLLGAAHVHAQSTQSAAHGAAPKPANLPAANSSRATPPAQAAAAPSPANTPAGPRPGPRPTTAQPAKPAPLPSAIAPAAHAAQPVAASTAPTKPATKPGDEAIVRDLELLMLLEMLKDYELLDD